MQLLDSTSFPRNYAQSAVRDYFLTPFARATAHCLPRRTRSNAKPRTDHRLDTQARHRQHCAGQTSNTANHEVALRLCFSAGLPVRATASQNTMPPISSLSCSKEKASRERLMMRCGFHAASPVIYTKNNQLREPPPETTFVPKTIFRKDKIVNSRRGG